jgi:hypothetical protein
MDEQEILPLIFVGVGATLLLVAAAVLFTVRRFVRNALRTQGTVVRFVERRGHKTGRTYSPVVDFTTQAGQFQFTETLSTNPPGYKVGDRVEVLYHWQDHNRARIASAFRLYFLPGLFGLLGIIFTSVGVILFFVLPAGQRW